MKKIAIIGSGSWGVSLAVYLANLGHQVVIWSFAEEEKNIINEQKKCKFIPDLNIPDHITCTLDYQEAIENAEIILHVTPSKFTRNIVRQYKQYVQEEQPIIICSKGFEAETLKTLDEVIQEELPNQKIGVLSGPSHAEEVYQNIPTALVVASEKEEVNQLVIEIFKSETLRLYTSNDVKGVELGGALKNIIAFCAGILTGLQLGDNTFAALLTRGLAEIARLGTAMGGNLNTFYGLTGLGDLIVTCCSVHSRNRKAGQLIGQGKNIQQVREEVGMTIESIDNIEVAYALGKKYKVELPIIETVYQVLFDGLDANLAVKRLMARELREE